MIAVAAPSSISVRAPSAPLHEDAALLDGEALGPEREARPAIDHERGAVVEAEAAAPVGVGLDHVAHGEAADLADVDARRGDAGVHGLEVGHRRHERPLQRRRPLLAEEQHRAEDDDDRGDHREDHGRSRRASLRRAAAAAEVRGSPGPHSATSKRSPRLTTTLICSALTASPPALRCPTERTGAWARCPSRTSPGSSRSSPLHRLRRTPP